MFKNLCILGSTGSIGRQTLEVVDEFSNKFKIFSLVANNNIEEFAKQINRYKPQVAVLKNKALFDKLNSLVNHDETRVLAGEENIKYAYQTEEVDLIVSAISGIAGLIPTIEGIRAGKNIALANKETLVAAGSIVIEEAHKNKVKLLPVDSEHSAIFQCLQGQGEVDALILTASGGSFRGYKLDDLKGITPEMALKHPNWSMGAKITIDSGTLANKGLEVIEAHYLFDIPYDKIEVIIHPESIIHSLVRFVDGSYLAQLGLPDMKLPIQYAFSYPERWKNNFSKLDLSQIAKLNFENPDHTSFPCLKLAYEVGKEGGTMPCVFNTANETAVELFLNKRISFLDIPEIIKWSLEQIEPIKQPTLEEIIFTDKKVREIIFDKYK